MAMAIVTAVTMTSGGIAGGYSNGGGGGNPHDFGRAGGIGGGGGYSSSPALVTWMTMTSWSRRRPRRNGRGWRKFRWPILLRAITARMESAALSKLLNPLLI